MAVTIDVGNSLDVHPRNKKVVGNRLASIAKTKTYGGNKSYSGPITSTIRQEKNSLIANFSHTDNHLTSHHNLTLHNDSQNSLLTKAQSKLLGFEIAGTDGIYHNIHAEVHNNSVILSPVNIGKVCSVRYAWADNPIASLFNSEGFPASPFEYVMTDNCFK
ncbi:hypothetical protein L3081_20940 [Colwellia sp. MSW7]|uniref:Uncharacterized protein n=1 Tax=Colwellia maritima TaxID=2912588 RepID=A0ABS9X577_9GAMM|nr:hypothetical protein [Colwellia maritima]MCI2285398.1 hypothetical protein [Colwellia maritima]